MLAPTGVTAFNINGIMIYSALLIPIITNKNLNIKGECLKQLQNRLKDVIYIIINEKSMISCQILGLIDMRLQQAFSEYSNVSFGSRSILMFGDFGQLSPVFDLPMYTKISQNLLSNTGLVAYNQFKEAYRLDVIQHQSGDTKEQRDFRELLLRLRNRETILANWKALATQFEGNINRIEHNRFSDTMFILTKWSDINTVNIDQLRSLNIPVAKILAIHMGRNKAKKANSDITYNFEAKLLLARGACVILTSNL